MQNSKLDLSIEVPPLKIKTISTVQKVNEANRKFWSEQSTLMETRMADPAILEMTISSVSSETKRRVPIYNQKSFEATLADSELAKTRAVEPGKRHSAR